MVTACASFVRLAATCGLSGLNSYSTLPVAARITSAEANSSGTGTYGLVPADVALVVPAAAGTGARTSDATLHQHKHDESQRQAVRNEEVIAAFGDIGQKETDREQSPKGRGRKTHNHCQYTV